MHRDVSAASVNDTLRKPTLPCDPPHQHVLLMLPVVVMTPSHLSTLLVHNALSYTTSVPRPPKPSCCPPSCAPSHQNRQSVTTSTTPDSDHPHRLVQFGAQEPGSPAEIVSFCTKNYGVTFPVMQKVRPPLIGHLIPGPRPEKGRLHPHRRCFRPCTQLRHTSVRSVMLLRDFSSTANN